MPTSRKRTKKRRRLRFPVILPGICILAVIIILAVVILLRGCSSGKASSPAASETETPESPAAVTESSGTDYSSFFGHKGTVTETCNLYLKTEDGLVPAGTFEGGAVLDIADSQELDLVQVADSPFYIHGGSLTPSDRWYRNDTHLLPYGTDIVTNASYEIQDERGSVIAHVEHSDRYPVYVKPGEDGRYGIRLQNTICYIPTGDVAGEEAGSQGASGPFAEEIPVLMYHFFYSADNGETRIDGNYVEVNELDEQLAYIKDNGFTACTMREIQYWMEGRAQLPSRSLAITIDDADPSVHQYAMPVFVKYGLNATNFVICGWQPAEMSYELWEMRENGMELQSHGFLTHTGGCSGMGHGGLLLCMDHSAGVEDTIRSFDYVDGGFVYCYPFGDINENAESIIRDGGAKLAFTTEGGRIRQSMDPLALPRVRVTGGNGLNAFAASIG